MKIVHRYIAKEIIRNIALSSMACCFLFLVIDFFDRIDNVLTEDASLLIIVEYFLLKIPTIFNLTLPIAMLVATMLTIGLLAKNSEITAMRSAGLKVSWIARPVFIIALGLSGLSLLVAETIVPYTQHRVREIYNIDIRRKHETGSYSQDNLWWRTGNTFFSAMIFDSRENALLNLTRIDVDENFHVVERVDASRTSWLSPDLGWSMHDITEYSFQENTPPTSRQIETLPLPISETPEEFYDARMDPLTMNYRQLKRFIRKQIATGLSAGGYYSDLYAKLSFPLVILVCAVMVLPFSLRPARSGSMAFSFLAGLAIGFTYFAVHSFSLAMGRAELWPPMLAAWTANVLMGLVGVILNLGAESPD